jgi:hypothetical protein
LCRYEAKNQELKKAAEASNYRDTAGTVVSYMAMQTARQRYFFSRAGAGI